MTTLEIFIQNVNTSKMFLKDHPFVTGETWDYLYDNYLEKQIDSPFGGEYFLNVDGERYLARIIENGKVRLYSIS